MLPEIGFCVGDHRKLYSVVLTTSIMIQKHAKVLRNNQVTPLKNLQPMSKISKTRASCIWKDPFGRFDWLSGHPPQPLVPLQLWAFTLLRLDEKLPPKLIYTNHIYAAIQYNIHNLISFSLGKHYIKIKYCMIQWILNQILRVDLSLIDTKGGFKEVGAIQTYGNLQSGSQRSWWPVCGSLSAWKWPLSTTNKLPLSSRAQDLRPREPDESAVQHWGDHPPLFDLPCKSRSAMGRAGRRWVVLIMCDQGTVLEAGSLPWVSWTWGIMKLQPNWKA